MPTLKRWMQSNFSELFEHCEQLLWKQCIARAHADLFANWQTQQAAVNAFAKYSSTRSLSEVDSGEAQIARDALAQLLRLPHLFMEGPAMEAVRMYAGGVDCTGDNQPFRTQCPVLLRWVRTDNIPFAPLPAAPSKRRMSGPYLLPEETDGDLEPINVSSYEKGSVWIDARAVISKNRPELLQGLPQFSQQHKRSFEYISAAEKYAAAVAQHPDKVSRLPTFDVYMQEVCPSAEGDEGETGSGGGD